MENIYIDYLIPERILLIYHNSTDYLLQYVSFFLFTYPEGLVGWHSLEVALTQERKSDLEKNISMVTF